MLFVRPTVLIECLGLSPFDPDAPPPPARPPPPRCFFAIVHVLAPLRRSSRFERSLARRRSNARVRSRLAHGLATRADVDAPRDEESRCAPPTAATRPRARVTRPRVAFASDRERTPSRARGQGEGRLNRERVMDGAGAGLTCHTAPVRGRREDDVCPRRLGEF